MNATGPRLSSVSAFFPCYNDSNTIAGLVGMVEFALRQITDDYEVIVVNDASTDNSAEVLAQMQAAPQIVRRTREPRLWRRSGQRLPQRHAKTTSSIQTATGNTTRPSSPCLPSHAPRRRRGQRLQDLATGPLVSPGHRLALPARVPPSVLLPHPRRGLRLPSPAPLSLRPCHPGIERRRHLHRVGAQASRLRLPHGGAARTPLRRAPMAPPSFSSRAASSGRCAALVPGMCASLCCKSRSDAPASRPLCRSQPKLKPKARHKDNTLGTSRIRVHVRARGHPLVVRRNAANRPRVAGPHAVARPALAGFSMRAAAPALTSSTSSTTAK